MQILLGFILVVGIIALYFLPTIIARKRKYYNGIFLINFFFGWTLIGWVAALVWAVSSPKKENKNG